MKLLKNRVVASSRSANLLLSVWTMNACYLQLDGGYLPTPCCHDLCSEADKLEEQQELGNDNSAMDTDQGEDAAAAMLGRVDEKNNAVAVITGNGIIQMVSKNLLKLFGYKKSELEGKNVSMLMPAPFSQRHNTYLRNYITTGEQVSLSRGCIYDRGCRTRFKAAQQCRCGMLYSLCIRSS